tara:strand:+ start:197 stop:370 length:174 start_codon:yes stop_codon:yes gene_type:complete
LEPRRKGGPVVVVVETPVPLAHAAQGAVLTMTPMFFFGQVLVQWALDRDFDEPLSMA